jgi:TonB family protein
MSHTRPADHYGRRLALMAGAALLVLVLVALLGPESDPSQEWYEHTGVRGEIQILDALSISRDSDPVDRNSIPEIEDATRGVDVTLTEKIVQPDPLNPLPKEDERGDYGKNVRRVDDSEAQEIVGENPVELQGRSQQSLNFLLLFLVNPEYPDGVAASIRQLEIVVATHLYVDEKGIVAQAYVSRNDGGPAFERAVLDAVRQWIYQPVLVDEVATGFWDTIYFVFRISEGGSAEIESERRGRNQIPPRGSG